MGIVFNEVYVKYAYDIYDISQAFFKQFYLPKASTSCRASLLRQAQ